MQLDKYSDLKSMDLRELHNLKTQLLEFIHSPIYEWFKHENKEAENEFSNLICGLAPNSIGDLVAREQAVGQLSLIRETKTWFESRIEELNEIMREKEHNEV